MGDEGHNRNRAGTSLFLRAIAPALVRTCQDSEETAKVIEFIDRNDHFFLNLTHAGRQGLPGAGRRDRGQHDRDGHGAQRHRLWHAHELDAAALVRRPGRDGAGAVLPRLYARRTPTRTSATAPSPRRPATAAIAMAAAPAITQFVGGTPQMAARSHAGDVRDHLHANTRASPFRRSTSAARRWASTCARWWRRASCRRSTPASPIKKPGIGQVGAGLLRAPQKCFMDAFNAIRELC